MRKIKFSQYTNEAPPYLNSKWTYSQYNTIMDRFKAMGWMPPSEKKGQTK